MKKGFTLIEAFVVVSILAIILSILLRYCGGKEESDSVPTRSDNARHVVSERSVVDSNSDRPAKTVRDDRNRRADDKDENVVPSDFAKSLNEIPRREDGVHLVEKMKDENVAPSGLVKGLNEIPRREDGVHLVGKMFDVRCNQGKVSVRVIDKEATAEDFVLFLHAEGWNAQINSKIASGGTLTIDELNLAKLTLNSDIQMLEAISLAMFVDWKILECKRFDADSAKRLGWSVPLANTDFAKTYPGAESVGIQFIDRFLNQESGFRGNIRDMTIFFKELPDDCAKAVCSFMLSPDKQGYTAGGTSKGVIDRLLQFRTMAPPRSRMLTPMEEAALKISVSPKEFSEKWSDVEREVLRYLKLAWQTQNALEKYGEGIRLHDVEVVKMLLGFNRVAKRCLEDARTQVVQSVYDYPFAILTFRSYGQYRKCKGFFSDDKDKMEAVMRQYGEVVSGTRMLTRVSSDVVIDLYERLLQDFKADLDLTPFSGRFQRVVTGARLKELSERNRKTDIETGMSVFDFQRDAVQ